MVYQIYIIRLNEAIRSIVIISNHFTAPPLTLRHRRAQIKKATTKGRPKRKQHLNPWLLLTVCQETVMENYNKIKYKITEPFKNELADFDKRANTAMRSYKMVSSMKDNNSDQAISM